MLSRFRHRDGAKIVPILLIAAFVVLPSTAKASSSWTTWWWGNWNSYSECMEYYTKHSRAATGWGYSPEEVCTNVQAAQDEKRREQAEMNRVLILSCRAASVSYDQFAACVALATGR